MTDYVLTQKKVDEIKPGDKFVSIFARKEGNYPEPQTVTDVFHSPHMMVISLEGRWHLSIIKGALVIVAERV